MAEDKGKENTGQDVTETEAKPVDAVPEIKDVAMEGATIGDAGLDDKKSMTDARDRKKGADKGGRKQRRKRQERPREQKEFDELVIQIDRVSRMMKGGRRMSFRASVVIGDRKSKVGFGIGKANEVQAAVQKAVTMARKRLIIIPLKDERTIPHRVDQKFRAAKIMIMPASEGTGVIAGGTIRAILELGGVKDCLSKNIGSTNKINIAKATIEALQGFRNK